MTEPTEVRKEMKRWRNVLAPECVRERSALAADRCIRLLSGEEHAALFVGIKQFLCYAPLGNEVDLWGLYEWLSAQGISLYFPVTQGVRMEFYPAESRDELVPGSFGVKEPLRRAREQRVIMSQKTAAFVPGVVFDESGNRMGYGKGCYDRFFSRHKNCLRIGIAYEGQIVSALEQKPWDVPMDVIVTEEKTRIINH